jgi:hypothetical protein
MNAGSEFNWVAFHARRKLFKIAGLVMVLVGLFTILDLMSRIPIPLTGFRAVFTGTLLMVLGFVALYKGYRLPLEEALDLVHRKGRGVTESEVVHDMRVDRPTAQRILAALIRKGFLRRTTQTAATDEVFEPVR